MEKPKESYKIVYKFNYRVKCRYEEYWKNLEKEQRK